MSLNELWSASAWCQSNEVTVRFYTEGAAPHVRVGVRIAPGVDDFVSVVVPCAVGDAETLANALVAARDELEPQLRRRTLRVVAEV